MSTQDIGQYSLAIRQNGLRLGVNEPLVALGSVDFSGASGFTPGTLTLTAAIGSNKVPLIVNQNDTTNNPNGFDITSATNGTALNVTTTATNTLISPALKITDSSTNSNFAAIFVQSARTGQLAELQHNLAFNSGIPNITLDGTQTITGAVTDGYHDGIRAKPTYSAATAQTVTRHNYLILDNPVLAGVGPAALTDAAVVRFNAAPGTHSALAANAAVATTLTSVGPTGAQTTVQGWMKVNVNGTLRYIPFW